MNDDNFIELLQLALVDDYELVQRFAVNMAGFNGNDALIPTYVKLAFTNLSERVEFNYVNYKMGNDDYFFTPYMFIDIGVFKMNPRTEYNGEMVSLQSIGTEGQGSDLTDENVYPLVQVAIPFGIGYKMKLVDKFAIALELRAQYTFVDDIDYNNQEIESLKFGNPNSNDWYMLTAISIVYSFGRPPCYATPY